MLENFIRKIVAYFKKNWRSYLFDIALIGLVLSSLHYWQTKDLLSSKGDATAPSFSLKDLNGNIQTFNATTASQTTTKERNTILYFFAPWCSVCHTCISNLEEIKQEFREDQLQIFAIALDYEDEKDVRAFVKKHELTFPVLFGSEKTKQDYKISAYPTYYLLDKNGVIHHRSVGYSTKLGILLRLKFGT